MLLSPRVSFHLVFCFYDWNHEGPEGPGTRSEKPPVNGNPKYSTTTTTITLQEKKNFKLYPKTINVDFTN